MANKVLQLDPRDNVLIALMTLKPGETVDCGEFTYSVITDVPAKHKFARRDLAPGADVIMYGVVVGKAGKSIRGGELLTSDNIYNQTAAFQRQSRQYHWTPPDVSRWKAEPSWAISAPTAR